MAERIAICFPAHAEDRAVLRHFVRAALPAKYPDGVERACARCGVVLDVGPRVQAFLDADPSIRLLCLVCGVAETHGADDVNVLNLGNPASKPETP